MSFFKFFLAFPLVTLAGCSQTEPAAELLESERTEFFSAHRSLSVHTETGSMEVSYVYEASPVDEEQVNLTRANEFRDAQMQTLIEAGHNVSQIFIMQHPPRRRYECNVVYTFKGVAPAEVTRMNCNHDRASYDFTDTEDLKWTHAFISDDDRLREEFFENFAANEEAH